MALNRALGDLSFTSYKWFCLAVLHRSRYGKNFSTGEVAGEILGDDRAHESDPTNRPRGDSFRLGLRSGGNAGKQGQGGHATVVGNRHLVDGELRQLEHFDLVERRRVSVQLVGDSGGYGEDKGDEQRQDGNIQEAAEDRQAGMGRGGDKHLLQQQE